MIYIWLYLRLIKKWFTQIMYSTIVNKYFYKYDAYDVSGLWKRFITIHLDNCFENLSKIWHFNQKITVVTRIKETFFYYYKWECFDIVRFKTSICLKIPLLDLKIVFFSIFMLYSSSLTSHNKLTFRVCVSSMKCTHFIYICNGFLWTTKVKI